MAHFSIFDVEKSFTHFIHYNIFQFLKYYNV